MMKTLRILWLLVLSLVLGLPVQAQQQVNNFRVLTNLYVGNAITGLTLNGYNIDAIATNSAAGKLDSAQGEVLLISPHAPLARQLQGLQEGDEVQVAGKPLTVVAYD